MNREKDLSNNALMDFDVTLKELLGRAVKAEIEEADIYRNLLDKELPEETKPKIERFVTQEEEHEEKLRATFEDFFPDSEMSLPERSGIELPEEINRQTTSRQLMKKAMDAEKDAEKFYRGLVGEFDDKEVGRLLGYLAANEREHYEILKVELNKLE